MTHLNITDTNQTGYVQTLLDAAVAYCEKKMQLDLRQTTWKLTIDQFPIWASYNWLDRWGNNINVYPMVNEYAIGRLTQRWQEIDLMRGPVKSITSVVYYDISNTLVTMASTDYTFSSPSYFHGRLEPTIFFPVSYPRPDAVQITFVTGMTTPSGSGYSGSVPASINQAIKFLCGQWYAMRENISYGPQTIAGMTGEVVDCLLDQYTHVAQG